MGLLSNISSLFSETRLYEGPKDPCWAYPVYEEIAERDRVRLWEGVWSIVDTLPFRDRVKDVEGCGSYFIGCAQAHSDFDFNVVLDSAEFQEQIAQEVYVVKKPSWAPPFVKKLHEVELDLGVHIEFSFSKSHRDYALVYSSIEEKYYNKQWGQKFKYTLKFDKDMEVFVKKPMKVPYVPSPTN